MGATEMGKKFVDLINVFEQGPASTSCEHDNGLWGLFPEVKRLWYEADHSSPSKAESKNTWSITYTAPYVFRQWCLIQHRKNVWT